MSEHPARPDSWKWLVCGLLLLATTINYMDRLTFNLTSERILTEFRMDEEQYGRVESAFAVAFATGALFMGMLADRINVRWLYAAAVLAWSVAGFATGFAAGFTSLIVCRFLLGLFEAGNWPCALRTTQRILPPEKRTLGNSILQSGASIGAILTPLAVVLLVEPTDSWRLLFWVVGALGLFWVGAWLFLVQSGDLALPLVPRPTGPVRWDRPAGWQWRRFLVLLTVVITINITWHFLRAWMPRFLLRQHGYTEREMALFSMAYYLATDVGALVGGFATLYLARRGLSVHSSRLVVFAGGAGLTSLSVLASTQPRGPLLLILLLLIGCGSLAQFPVYYSLSQELTSRHQGKLTGLLGCLNWVAMAILHEVVGSSVKESGSYSAGIALAGLAPLMGLAALLLLWGQRPEENPPVANAPGSPEKTETPGGETRKGV